jgi:hypothetical protein
MSFRFVVLKGAAGPHHDWALSTLERTYLATIGTGLFLTQLDRLLQCRHLQGAGQQSTHGRHRHLFHLVEIDIQTGSLLAPMLPHNDFSPTLGQFLDVLDIF